MTENLEKIRPALVALEVGDSVTFHISRLKSVPHASLGTGSDS